MEYTQDQFDEALIRIINGLTISTIRSYPGVMEILTEELNNDVLTLLEEESNAPVFKEDGVGLIPVHINKCRDDNFYWDWSSDHGKWIRGTPIPENLKRMYKNPKP